MALCMKLYSYWFLLCNRHNRHSYIAINRTYRNAVRMICSCACTKKINYDPFEKFSILSYRLSVSFSETGDILSTQTRPNMANFISTYLPTWCGMHRTVLPIFLFEHLNTLWPPRVCYFSLQEEWLKANNKTHKVDNDGNVKCKELLKKVYIPRPIIQPEWSWLRGEKLYALLL